MDDRAIYLEGEPADGHAVDFTRLCTVAELWAAIEDVEAKAERYGLATELDGPANQARAMSELIAARARVRELLGMEGE